MSLSWCGHTRTEWHHAVHTLYIHYTYAIHTLYIHYTYTIHTLYIHCTYAVHTLYIHYTYIIHTLYILYTYTMHTLYICCVCICIYRSQAAFLLPATVWIPGLMILAIWDANNVPHLQSQYGMLTLCLTYNLAHTCTLRTITSSHVLNCSHLHNMHSN